MVALKSIQERRPETRVVVFGDGSTVEVETMLRLGAAAYVVRSVDPIDLPGVIRLVAAGSMFTSVGGHASREGVRQRLGLSVREFEILSQVAGGASNKAIAAVLFVTEETVKFHLANVYRKLGVKSRTEAARLAFVHGLDEAATQRASTDQPVCRPRQVPQEAELPGGRQLGG
jgi:DNA-binding NarL/FixJ family response regulator